MKDQQKGKLGKNTGKQATQDKQDNILRETAIRYEKSSEPFHGDFEKALKQASPLTTDEIEAEIRAILDGSDDVNANPYVLELKRIRIALGLSIDELTKLTGSDISVLESGQKHKMLISEVKKVFEYFEKLNK